MRNILIYPGVVLMLFGLFVGTNVSSFRSTGLIASSIGCILLIVGIYRFESKGEVEMGRVYHEFQILVDTEAIKHNISAEQYSYHMIEQFLKFLKRKGIKLVGAEHE